LCVGMCGGVGKGGGGGGGGGVVLGVVGGGWSFNCMRLQFIFFPSLSLSLSSFLPLNSL